MPASLTNIDGSVAACREPERSVRTRRVRVRLCAQDPDACFSGCGGRAVVQQQTPDPVLCSIELVACRTQNLDRDK